MRFLLYALTHLGVLSVMCLRNYMAKGSVYHMMTSMVDNRIEHFVACSFAIFTVYLGALGMLRAFVGKLTPIESESVHEHGLRFLGDIFLVVTVFTEDINLKGLVVFSIVFTFKCLNWILGSRIDTMDQSVTLQTRGVVKIFAFTGVLIFFNAVLAYATMVSAFNRPSVYILFCFEFSLLLVYSMRCLYVLAIVVIDYEKNLHDKSFLIFYGDFVFGVFKILAYIVCFYWTTQHFKIPLNLLREGIGTTKALVSKTRLFWAYRKIVKDLEKNYPDFAGEQITGDRTCVICHEEMERAKRLHCGHFFHFECLRGWLDRQQACPVCRREVTPSEERRPPDAGAARPGAGRVYFRTENGEYEGVQVILDDQ